MIVNTNTVLSYSPLNTVVEEEGDDGSEDLNLGPIKKYYRMSKKSRYHDLFHPYDIESPIQGSRNRFSNRIFGEDSVARNRCLIIFMAVILIIVVISALAFVSTASPSSHLLETNPSFEYTPGKGKRGITLEDVLSGKFYSRPFNGSWISDTEIQYFGSNGDLLLYNVETNSISQLISSNELYLHLERKPPVKCSISADRNFVLLSYDAQKIFRYSSYAKYVIHDLKTKEFHPLVPTALANAHKLIQLASWGPVNNSLVFVYENNIYYKASAMDKASLQITKDGSQLIYNGVTDWVYEEEMFNSDVAVWFSPDGSHLAFVSFNDTQVDEIQFQVYGDPGNPGFQYPMIESFPYPKAGRTNPIAQVSMVGLDQQSSESKFLLKKNLQFPNILNEHYIAAVVWATNSEMLVVTLNRHQNDSRHHLCTLNNNCHTLLVDQQMNGWIDVEIPLVSSDGKSFLAITSQFQGDKWYRHILLYQRHGVNKPMSNGSFSVDKINEWDEPNSRIYFTAPFYDPITKKSIPSTSHLYFTEYKSDFSIQRIKCLTCGSTNTFNESCQKNMFEFSKNGTYIVQTCAGPNVPQILVKPLQDMVAQPIVWIKNRDLRERFDKVAHPVIKNFEVPIDHSLNIKIRLQLPPNLDPTKKYPMLVDVYAGPSSQKITDAFMIDWSDSLITSKGIIYATIDGRGSGRQSDDLKFQVYRKLGTVEVEDQIYGTDWLIKNLPYIDKNRVAIWGWSYGGFATATAIAKDSQNVFKCGISVAPVTNWMFYDTIYTERYMGLPTLSDNFVSYNSSDLTTKVENFRNRKFFLVHGNADDNVHYQQSMILSRALEKADILFRQLSYPDENHSLGGVRRHLYHTLENFLFTECFN